jgi:putative ABC transport system ATP-binding protein
MILLSKISQRFERPDGEATLALQDVSLEIPRGEFLLLAGTNGSGKSTLLNVLAGTFPPTSGQVQIDGVDVTRQGPEQRASKLARVFQNPYLSTAGTLTVAENMRLAELRGGTRILRLGLNRSAKARHAEALAACGMGLENFLDRPTNTLSGGQRQALAVVMATVVTPKVLLLDEHTAALDPEAAEKVMQLTARLVAEHAITTVMVTHSLDHLPRFGARAVLLHLGRVQEEWSGEAKAAMTSLELQRRFASLYGG